MPLKRVLNTKSTFDENEVIGTSDDGKVLTLIFRGGGTLIFDDPVEREAAWSILWPNENEVPPEGDWKG